MLESASSKKPTSSVLTDSLSVTAGALRASLLPVSHLIEHVIGVRDEGKQLIFLDKDLWVCSYELESSSLSSARRASTDHSVVECTRHLFIPDDWISSTYSSANSELLFILGGIRQDCLVFAKKHEVAVIKQPFAHSERRRVT